MTGVAQVGPLVMIALYDDGGLPESCLGPGLVARLGHRLFGGEEAGGRSERPPATRGATDLLDPLEADIALATRHRIDAFCFDAATAATPDAPLNRLRSRRRTGFVHCVRMQSDTVGAPMDDRAWDGLFAHPDYLRVDGQPVVVVEPGAANPAGTLAVAASTRRGPTGELVCPPAYRWLFGRQRVRRKTLLAAATFKSRVADAMQAASIGKRPAERVLLLAPWHDRPGLPGIGGSPAQGHPFLHAISGSLADVPASPDALAAIADWNARFAPRHDACVVLHLHYEDLAPRFIDELIAPLGDSLDLIVSVRPSVGLETIKHIQARCPHTRFMVEENRGRDMRPFLSALRLMTELGYRYGCKVHTKKSPHRADGDRWRESLVGDLLATPDIGRCNLDRLRREADLGLIAPMGSMTSLADPSVHRSNRTWLDRSLTALGQGSQIGRYDFSFPAGSMYWFRTAALARLPDCPPCGNDSFEPELGQIDGTLAHAIERLVGLVAELSGFRVEESAPTACATMPHDLHVQEAAPTSRQTGHSGPQAEA